MQNYKHVAIPIDTNSKLSVNVRDLMDDMSTYQSLVGALQYLILTKSYILYVIQQVYLFIHALRE